jgi:hypothetical protein
VYPFVNKNKKQKNQKTKNKKQKKQKTTNNKQKTKITKNKKGKEKIFSALCKIYRAASEPARHSTLQGGGGGSDKSVQVPGVGRKQ